MAASSSSPSLPLNTMVHMLTIKLTFSNYLLWRHQFIPLLTNQDLFGFLDGSVRAPSPKVIGSDGAMQVNPSYTSWLNTDQTILSLLYFSLTKESMSEVLGLSHAHEAWTILEASFSHRSKTRELQLNDELQLMQRGSKSVVEFSRLFKGICDQLAAIGRPIDDLDKVHWFLRALGPYYKIFSITMLFQLLLHSFADIVLKALSHEIFERSLSQQSTNSAFYAQQNSSTRPKNTKRGNPKHSFTSASKSSTSSPVYCQLCDKEGHLAKCCRTFLNLKKKQSANLAEAFATCSISNSNDSDWYLDFGATSHMTHDPKGVDVPVVYSSNERVTVGNGQ